MRALNNDGGFEVKRGSLGIGFIIGILGFELCFDACQAAKVTLTGPAREAGPNIEGRHGSAHRGRTMRANHHVYRPLLL
jgi:hypothetical protein